MHLFVFCGRAPRPAIARAVAVVLEGVETEGGGIVVYIRRLGPVACTTGAWCLVVGDVLLNGGLRGGVGAQKGGAGGGATQLSGVLATAPYTTTTTRTIGQRRSPAMARPYTHPQ